MQFLISYRNLNFLDKKRTLFAYCQCIQDLFNRNKILQLCDITENIIEKIILKMSKSNSKHI